MAVDDSSSSTTSADTPQPHGNDNDAQQAALPNAATALHNAEPRLQQPAAASPRTPNDLEAQQQRYDSDCAHDDAVTNDVATAQEPLSSSASAEPPNDNKQLPSDSAHVAAPAMATSASDEQLPSAQQPLPPSSSSTTGASTRTSNGTHPMYPSFPVAGMLAPSSSSSNSNSDNVVSPSHQLQFPYASSNFIAPMPTPIRPLLGDPRAGASTQPLASGTTDSSSATSAVSPAASSEATAGRALPVPASRMFHHQTHSPSFLHAASDEPAAPVAIAAPLASIATSSSSIDAPITATSNNNNNSAQALQTPWDPTSDSSASGAPAAAASVEPQWHTPQSGTPSSSAESSDALRRSDCQQMPSQPPPPPDPKLPPPPFAARTLVAQPIDDNVFAIEPTHLARMLSYAKNVTTPAQATAMAVDVLRATAAAAHGAHGWKDPFHPDEYEVLLQKGSIGLCMNMSVRLGSVTVTSFRRPEGGIVGPAEASGMIGIGDALIAVDGYRVQSQDDFARVVSRLKSLRPVLLRFRRPSGSGVALSALAADPLGYRSGLRTAMNGFDNPEMFTAGMWEMGVRYVAPGQWAAELHVDGGGIRRLGVYPTEKDAALAYNRYIHQTYGNSAIKFMNPAGTTAGAGASAAARQHPGVAVSNVRDVKPVQRRVVTRVAFTTEQKDQLRAQIMVFKYSTTQTAAIPTELFSRALKTTAHNHLVVQQQADVKKKRKTFTAHTVTKPVKAKKAKRSTSAGRRGKKKPQYSDEDDDADSQSDGAGGTAAVKEAAKPTRRSGRNAGKAKKTYVKDERDSEFELSDDEKAVRAKEREQLVAAPKGPQIDKIVSIRFHKAHSTDADVTMQFLIKWKDVSYLHVSWLTVHEVERFGRHSVMRMRRYLQKNSRMVESARDAVVVGVEKDLSAYFSDAYVEVDRILDVKEVEEPEEVNPYTLQAMNNTDDPTAPPPVLKRGRKYLVKWRDLSYVDCSWEWEDDVTDDRKIAAFERYNHPPILNGAHPAMLSDVRPDAHLWAKYLESPVYHGQNTLRPYQLEGLNWMVFCWYNRRNCILADEMGLGKTVQATAILEHLRQREHIRGPFLVVAPLATLGNWKREIETWTSMNCVVYHDSEGGADIRAFIREHEFHFTGASGDTYKKRGVYKFNVLVTSYQMLMSDAEYLDTIHWRYVVIDEAHKLKNREAKLLQSLRTFHWDSCLLMTGTPLQNGVFELWCLLNFIEPDKFPSQQSFYDEYGDLNTAEQVARLHEQLRPYMLRRVKEDVEKSIPPKEETIVDVELTTMQKKYYRAIFERNRSFLNMGASGTVANLVNVEMELRKCCNHPFLIKGVEEKECARFDDSQRTNILVQASGKTVLLDKLMAKFKAEGKKILIFSQFKIMLDIIEDLCQLRGFAIERLDGSVRGNSRQAAIDRFNNPTSETFAFLLSTRAGGVGINLIAASVVILFDSDWNPQNDLQAVARCHRIGQTQAVNIYRLVTKKTYEAQMFDIASKKLGMHHAVFETGGVRNEFDGEDDDSSTLLSLMSLDREKVEMMIRYGAYAIMGDNDDDEHDPENRAINELDIDQLLSSSRTIRYDPTRSNSSGSQVEGGDGDTGDTKAAPSTALSFSKATFTSETSDSTIDFNDEQFWEKVLGPKPVQLLMTKVQEGWLSTASTDDVRSFLTQLRELARAVVSERQRGGSLADADQVMAILIELKVTGPIRKGVVNVRAVAAEWLDVIERPKRRRNQDVESELMYLEFLDGSKADTPLALGKKKKLVRRGRRKANGSSATAVGKRGSGSRKKMLASDDDDHDNSDVDGRGSRGKKATRKTTSGSSVSGIRIKLTRVDATAPFTIDRIESTKRKVQRQLPTSGEAVAVPTSDDAAANDAAIAAAMTNDSDDDDTTTRPRAVSVDGDDDDDDDEEEEEEEEIEDEDEDEDDDEADNSDDDDDDATPQKKQRRRPAAGGNPRGRKPRKRAAPAAASGATDSEMRCRVCFSDVGFVDDPIVQCEKCDVAVHKYCYGIETVPVGDAPWFCDACAEVTTPTTELVCALCPLQRPSCAFKKTVDGDWAHVVCALWAPGVQFADVERMGGIKHVVEAVAEMRGHTCAVCAASDGCIKCCRGACQTYFHPLCGRESKGDYDMFMNGGGQLRAFCPKHRTRARRMI